MQTKEDQEIVELYWSRDENAIRETDVKYGRLCHYIANHILSSDEDCEECVNDTYFAVWNAIPPKRPDRFSAYLGRIIRNLALNRFDYLTAEKRSVNVVCSLEEIGLTLLLPDEWKGNYSVEVGEMEGGYLYTFYDSTIHGQGGEWTDSGALFFIGTYGDMPMTEAEMDAEHHHAYAYEYLFSTRTTNYIMVYVSDMQCDPGDPVMTSHYDMLVQGVRDIRFILDDVL